MANRYPEDGQRLIFETGLDSAVELFCETKLDGWCRLKLVCADVFAVYTADRDVDFTVIAVRASHRFDYAYFYRDFGDNPTEIVVWRHGEKWISEIPDGRVGKRLTRRFQGTLFTESNAQMRGKLWQRIDEFCSSPIGAEEFLLEQ